MAAGRLNIIRNQFAYLGLFASPMVEWFGNFSEPSKALLKAFLPMGYGLDSLHITTATPQASQQSVQVVFGTQGNYLCKLDRCEANFFNLEYQAQIQAAKVLTDAGAALREASPDLLIRSHQFTYIAHGQLEAKSVDEMLGQFHIQAPKQGGASQGTGVIFHWRVPEKSWETQLTLDASMLVKGGLFFSFSLTTEKDLMDFTGVLKAGRVYLAGVLEQTGVVLPVESDT